MFPNELQLAQNIVIYALAQRPIANCILVRLPSFTHSSWHINSQLQEKLNDGHTSPEQAASSLGNNADTQPSVHADARASLKGALGELIAKGNSMPHAYRLHAMQVLKGAMDSKDLNLYSRVMTTNGEEEDGHDESAQQVRE